jgi:hypothetical protein
MSIFLTCLLVLIAFAILVGVVLGLMVEINPLSHLDLFRIFPPTPVDDLYLMIYKITGLDSLWFPGRGDMPDLSEDKPVDDFPTTPWSNL